MLKSIYETVVGKSGDSQMVQELKAELESLQRQLASSRIEQFQTIEAMQQELAMVKQFAEQTPPSKEFIVAQYNILAGYLGDNRQPWFLYGIDVSEERRAQIITKFYQRDENGKYANAGWPKYVTGILSDEEMKIVEERHKSRYVPQPRPSHCR